jgi:transglutaminase-like putative cysteine protease
MTQPSTAHEPTVVRHVHASLECVLRTRARIVLQIAVADGPPRLSESLRIELDGKPCEVTEIGLAVGGRAHVVQVQPGTLTVAYEASVGPGTTNRQVTETDRLIYSRPSRYSESDKLFPMAVRELPSVLDADDLTVMNAVVAFVTGRTAYIVGSSRVTDGAVDTLLANAGVCRDFVHLSVGLLRALGLAARATAVYAPGLYPMDFHAVTEVAIGGHWRVIDTTGLAPRQTLVRIATGRDAADNAFLDVPYGQLEVVRQEVMALADPVLPFDDMVSPVQLA